MNPLRAPLGCHPERSEGSLFFARLVGCFKILRFAHDDTYGFTKKRGLSPFYDSEEERNVAWLDDFAGAPTEAQDEVDFNLIF